MIFFSINICSIFPRGVGGNNLAAFSVLLTFVLFLILGHPFPTQQPGLRSCLWPQPYCQSIHVFSLRQDTNWVQAAGWHSQIKTLWILKMIPLLVLSLVIKAKQLSSGKQSCVHGRDFPISTLKMCVRNDGKWDDTEGNAGNRALNFHVSVDFFYCSFKKIVAHYWSSFVHLNIDLSVYSNIFQNHRHIVHE